MTALPREIQEAAAAGELVHPAEAFDPQVQIANAEGWGNGQILERFAWDYEILGQLQRELGPQVPAFGGTDAMLHIAFAAQRASVDTDVFCSVSEAEFEAALKRIEQRLGRFDPTSTYFRFAPRPPQLQIPIPKRAYDFTAPSVVGSQWRKSADDEYQPGCHIKLEVLFAPGHPKPVMVEARVLPFAKTGPHAVLPRPQLTAMKLLALAACEVGLPPNRLDEMVKHVYDAAQLLTFIRTREDLDELRGATEEMLALENRWHKPPAQLGDCAVAVRSTLALLGRSVMADRAAGFAGTYLRSSPSPEQWAVWGQLVKHLAFVAMGRMGPADFLAVQRTLPKLMQKSINTKVDRPLRRELRARLRQLDLSSGSSEDQFQAYLFSEIAFRAGYEEARKVVDNILGPGWDA